MEGGRKEKKEKEGKYRTFRQVKKSKKNESCVVANTYINCSLSVFCVATCARSYICFWIIYVYHRNNQQNDVYRSVSRQKRLP